MPHILAITAGLVIGALLLIWTALGLVYTPLVWLVAFYGNRNLNLRQSRRVAGAALLPGALFMIVAVIVYGFGAMDLIQLLAALAGHFVVSWVYLFAAPLALRTDSRLEPPKSNPFARQPRGRT